MATILTLFDLKSKSVNICRQNEAGFDSFTHLSKSIYNAKCTVAFT